MQSCKELLKLLPPLISDIVLRIKLDKAHAQFDPEHNTDWEYQHITPQDITNTLPRFHSTKHVSFCIQDNGASNHMKVYRETRYDVVETNTPTWLVPCKTEALSRQTALRNVVRSLISALSSGETIQHLVSLRISNVCVCSPELALLIKSNQYTLKSITLDGTMLHERARMGDFMEFEAIKVMEALSRCTQLECLEILYWFTVDQHICNTFLRDHLLLRTLTIHHDSLDCSVAEDIADSLCERGDCAPGFNLKIRSYAMRNSTMKSFLKCLPHLNSLELDLPDVTDEGYFTFTENLPFVVTKMRTLTLKRAGWPWSLASHTEQTLRDTCHNLNIDLHLSVE